MSWKRLIPRWRFQCSYAWEFKPDPPVPVQRAAENRSVTDLLTADWTFLNEALARQYDVPGCAAASSVA
jgi:hypothetical protein